MRNPKIIEVEINEDGSISIDGQGFEGKECEILAELAKKLGTNYKETRKREYYLQKVAQRQRR